MSYNSAEVEEFDIARFKAVLDQFNFGIFTPQQKLAFAEAMELKAAELRQDAIRDDSVSSSEN